MNNLPAGLLDNNGEFFVDQNSETHLLTGRQVIDIGDFSPELRASILQEMYNQPAMLYAYYEMGAVSENDLMNLFLHCNWGGLDGKADLVDGKLQAPEYWACPKRGTCEFEGIGCSHLLNDNGEKISLRLVEVIRLIALGDLDKMIADKLNISITTVTTHNKVIRQKLGLSRKADITRFAYKNQIIS